MPNICQSARAGVVLAFAVTALLAGTPGHAAAARDPYRALKLYDGRWAMMLGDGHAFALTNRCAQLARAYVCEQLVDGKPVAMVIYVPGGDEAGNATYDTLAVPYGGAPPGPWSKLTIDGDHWEYRSSQTEAGHTSYSRVVNDFDGPDHIRFVQQRSVDGTTWTTVTSGDEQRVPTPAP